MTSCRFVSSFSGGPFFALSRHDHALVVIRVSFRFLGQAQFCCWSFCLEYALVCISYIKEEGQKKCLHRSYKRFKTLYSSHLSHLANRLKKGFRSPFSRPANNHTKPSSLILLSSTSHEGRAPSKTIAFLCFHSSHKVSPRMVRKSFVLALLGPILPHNHDVRESCCDGTQSGFPKV